MDLDFTQMYLVLSPFLISIGDNVTVTSRVRFVTHDDSAWLMRDEKGRRFLYQGISIGNNVLLELIRL